MNFPKAAIRLIDLETLTERFWERTDKGATDDCWEWQGAINHQTGYGSLVCGYNERKFAINMYAHRFSFQLHFGDLDDGLQACHDCDNPPCVNPRHLFSGTQLDNTRDMIAKGRYRAGNYADKVLLILELHNQGMPSHTIGKQLDIPTGTIRNILTGKSYNKPQTTLIERPFVQPNPFVGHFRPTAKLSPDDVRFIRQHYKQGQYTIYDLADRFGVDISLISRVGRNIDGRYREVK